MTKILHGTIVKMNRHVSGVEEEYHSAVSRSQNASIKVEEGKEFWNFYFCKKNLTKLKIALRALIDKETKNFRFFCDFFLIPLEYLKIFLIIFNQMTSKPWWIHTMRLLRLSKRLKVTRKNSKIRRLNRKICSLLFSR